MNQFNKFNRLDVESSHKTRENASEMDERLYERLDQRHKFAIAAYKLEQFLEGDSKEKDFDTFIEGDSIDPLPNDVKDRFIDIIESYKKEEQRTITQDRWMRELFQLNIKKDVDPKEYGDIFFKKFSGIVPTGDVEMVRHGVMFSITFEKKSDLATLLKGKHLNGNYIGILGVKLHFKLKDLFGWRQFEKMTKEINSLPSDEQFFYEYGTFILNFEHPFAEQTQIHERQHAINDGILKNFRLAGSIDTKIEPSIFDSKDYVTSTSQTKIKDELLARVRDGSGGWRLRFINEYSYLIKDKNELEEAEKIIESFARIVDESIFFTSSEARAILVNHLYFEPFQKVVKRTEQLEAFYKIRMKDFIKERKKYNFQVNDAEVLSRRKYPSHFLKQQNHLGDVAAKYREEMKKIEVGSVAVVVNNKSVIEILDPLKDAYQALQDDYKKFNTLINGQPYLISAKLGSQEQPSTKEYIANVGQQVLDVLSAISTENKKEVFYDSLTGAANQEIVSVDWLVSCKEGLSEAKIELEQAVVFQANESDRLMVLRVTIKDSDGVRLHFDLMEKLQLN